MKQPGHRHQGVLTSTFEPRPRSVCLVGMLSRVFSSLVRVRVTLAYAAALFLIASLLLMLGPSVQDQVVRHLEHQSGEPGAGPLGNAFCQCLRHRRGLYVPVAAGTGVPAGTGGVAVV